MADLKTLKVCLSRDLPSLQDRDRNTIYFLRDKLVIYLGKSMYHDPYAIVEDVPDEPVTGLLYFLLSDGTVRSYMEYQVITIAQIENEEQLELLKQTGSIFFVNSQRRYLDLSRRIVTLPYNNGTYELTVDMANSLKIDSKTVIGFNPATNMFEMVGDMYDEVIYDYRGKNTNSIDTIVSDKRISGEVKISEAYNNIIRIANDGLYAEVKDRVTKTQFDSWANSFKEYKTYMESYLSILSEKIDENEQKVSVTTISEKILNALEDKYPEIDYALEKFAQYTEQFVEIESRVKSYSNQKFEEMYTLLLGQIREATEDPWEEFTVEEPITPNNVNPEGDENIIPENEVIEPEEPENMENISGENTNEPDNNVSGDLIKDESTSGESNPDYNTGVENQGTTEETEDGDDTTPIEDNTSGNLPGDNTGIQEEIEESNPESEEVIIEDELGENSEKESSEVTEIDTSTGDGNAELTESEENTDTSTDLENSEQNPIDP